MIHWNSLSRSYVYIERYQTDIAAHESLSTSNIVKKHIQIQSTADLLAIVLRIWIFTATEPRRFGGYRANTPLLSNPKIKKMTFFFNFFNLQEQLIEKLHFFCSSGDLFLWPLSLVIDLIKRTHTEWHYIVPVLNRCSCFLLPAGWLIHLRYGFRASLHHARSSRGDKNSVFFGLL